MHAYPWKHLGDKRPVAMLLNMKMPVIHDAEQYVRGINIKHPLFEKQDRHCQQHQQYDWRKYGSEFQWWAYFNIVFNGHRVNIKIKERWQSKFRDIAKLFFFFIRHTHKGTSEALSANNELFKDFYNE